MRDRGVAPRYARALVEAANARGGEDNTTVIEGGGKTSDIKARIDQKLKEEMPDDDEEAEEGGEKPDEEAYLTPTQRALKQIRNQGDRCKQITHKLLSFARKTDMRMQEINVYDLRHRIDADFMAGNAGNREFTLCRSELAINPH